MMIPTVHTNGTGKKDLLEELETAVRAVREARKAVLDITVHGRDYYVQGSNAYAQARTEMDVRLAALNQVRDDLQVMYAEIQKQGR